MLEAPLLLLRRVVGRVQVRRHDIHAPVQRRGARQRHPCRDRFRHPVRQQRMPVLVPVRPPPGIAPRRVHVPHPEIRQRHVLAQQPPVDRAQPVERDPELVVQEGEHRAQPRPVQRPHRIGHQRQVQPPADRAGLEIPLLAHHRPDRRHVGLARRDRAQPLHHGGVAHMQPRREGLPEPRIAQVARSGRNHRRGCRRRRQADGHALLLPNPANVRCRTRRFNAYTRSLAAIAARHPALITADSSRYAGACSASCASPISRCSSSSSRNRSITSRSSPSSSPKAATCCW